jgi:hypothetical protein
MSELKMTGLGAVFLFFCVQSTIAQQGGSVYQTVDSACNWTTYHPNGTVLSTAATLQDGVNHAQALGVPFVAEGSRNCPISHPVTFGPAIAQSYVLRNVWLQYAGAGPAVTLDSLYGGSLEWSGAIQYGGSYWTVVLVSPTSITGPAGFWNYPLTGFGSVQFPLIIVYAGEPHSIVTFNAPAGAITNHRFRFETLLGGCHVMNGITVNNPPGNPFFAIVQNLIEFNLIGGFKSVGIQEGNGVINPMTQPLGTNRWVGSINGDCANVYAAYQTWGVMSQASFPSISVNAGALQYGVMFQVSSSRNYVIAPQLEGAQPVVDLGSGNKVVTPPFN